jgi:peroxiredoxin
MPQRFRCVLLTCFALGGLGGPALALGPGDPAPPFELPRLQDGGAVRAPGLFSEGSLTVLVFWNRGCPECTAVAMGMQVLADSLRSPGAQVIGVAFGPDDPVSIQDQLRQHQIAVPQLWDAAATVAARYGIGLQHLGVFLVDSAARVRGVFDDRIPSLVDHVLPAARRILASEPERVEAGGHAEPASAGPGDGTRTAQAPAGPREPTAPAFSVLAALKLDARFKLLSTEGARSGDRGLYDEPLENGALFLYRYDVRLSWTPFLGVELVPWLRVSNEEDRILTEGADQLSNPLGSATLNLRHGRTAAVLGAFPLRVAPLLLQRWDAADAPLLGGVSGCACEAGAAGVSQRSLEILGPEYTFEGLSVSHAERWAMLRAWFAVPRWERVVLRSAPARERETARYRRLLSGALCDLGTSGARDVESGLPSPVGVRVGVLSVADDGRTLGPEAYRPIQHDEWGWVAETRLEARSWLSGEAQLAGWKLNQSGHRSDASAWLAGIRSSFAQGPVSFWMRLHRLFTEPDFDPLYRALTYKPNQQGWRIAGGLGGWSTPASRKERLSASAFYRTARETEERQAPGLGKSRSTVLSVTLGARPPGGLVAELSAVETKNQIPLVPMQRSRGLSLDLRLERWAFLDPGLRVDAIRSAAWSETRNIWQASAWVRLVR